MLIHIMRLQWIKRMKEDDQLDDTPIEHPFDLRNRHPLRIEIKLFYYISSEINDSKEIRNDIDDFIEMANHTKEKDFTCSGHEEDIQTLIKKFGNKYKASLYRREWELFTTKETGQVYREKGEK